MSTEYPAIANCNYESGEVDTLEIHHAREAVDADLTDDETLTDALEGLNQALIDELDENGELVHGQLSSDAIECAEGVVIEAWTDAVQDTVERVRHSRYSG